ncbi:MAG: hypothetical protein K2Q97_17950 [Burkholderiaceae bacterium]|nr:hypothetical protein [Burkholderiaceae bacterium]
MPYQPPRYNQTREAKAALARRSQHNGMQWVALCFAPFLGWFFLTLLMVLLQPVVTLPRQLVPGDGLVWQGLAMTGAVTVGVLWRVQQATQDRVGRRVLSGLALLGGLFSWPVVTLGPLPSINGAWLKDARTTPLQLVRLTTSSQKHSNEPYHWAYLQPIDADAGVAQGRVLIRREDFEQWTTQPTRTVQLTHHRGLLGARVVTGVTGVTGG